MAYLPPEAPRLVPPPQKVRPPQTPEQRQHYGWQHSKWRAELLQRFPLCMICRKAWATDAAHKYYPATSIDSYLALCHPCHLEYDRSRSN